MSMGVESGDMMGVDFVARCLAMRGGAGGGKNKYGTFEPITILTPLLIDFKAEKRVLEADMFTKDWTCDPKYVFNGFFSGSYGGRTFRNAPDDKLITDIIDTPSTRIIVGSYYGCPIVISTDPKDCQMFNDYSAEYMPVCPKTVEYIGKTWYYGAISYGYHGSYYEYSGQTYPYTGDPTGYEILNGWAYPTQEMVEGILTLIDPKLKEEAE